jgi:hypothetical protein
MDVLPWVKKRGYCTKIHNALGVLSDGSLVMGEGNHFTWDGIPVTTNYFDTELPESMLERKKAQGFPDVKYNDFCLENLEDWNRNESDPGGKIVRHSPETGKSAIIADGGRGTTMDEDDDGGILIGSGYPHMRLLRFQPDTKNIEDMGQVNDKHPRCYFHASCYYSKDGRFKNSLEQYQNFVDKCLDQLIGILIFLIILNF